MADSRDRPTKTAERAVLLVLCLGTLALFAPLRHAGFLNYDDNFHVTNSPMVRAGLTAEGVRWAFTNLDFNWHPLTWLSHMLDCQLFGLDPAGHHLTSVLMHTAIVALLFRVLLAATGSLWPSAFVAAVFSFHPAHVEAVAWISARPHLIGSLAWFVGLLGYLRYVERPTRGRYAVVLAAMLCDVVNRGVSAPLPFVLLLFDYWPLRRVDSPGRWRALVVEKIPLFATALAGLLVQVVVKQLSGALRSFEQVPAPLRAANAIIAYAEYPWKMLWPVDLILPYTWPDAMFPAGRILAAAAALVAASAAVFAFGRRRRPYLVTGWLWYLVTLLPVLGLLAVGHQRIADRYTYVSSVGLLLIVAWGAEELVRRRPGLRHAAALAGALVVVACAAASRPQIDYWHDSFRLFGHTLSVDPGNYYAHVSLGAALEDVGRLEDAVPHYEAAIARKPDFAMAYGYLGALLLDLGDYAGAERRLREALRLDPESIAVRTSLALARLELGDAAEARRLYADVVVRQPWNAAGYDGVARTLQAEGRLPEAIAEFERALRVDPGRAGTHYRLGRALEAAGRREEAIARYREALRLEPGAPDFEAALRAAGG